MKRDISLPVRLGIAGAAFTIVFCAAMAATYFSYLGLSRSRWEHVAMFGLLMTWSLLAYFPARQLYLAATYRVFRDAIHCEGCGYDLTGNESGVCSECGRPVPPKARCPEAPPLQQRSESGNRERGRRKFRHLLVGALCGAFIVGVLWLVVWEVQRESYVISDDFERTPSPFYFVRWNRDYEFANLDGDSIFAVFNGKILARFTFQSQDKSILDSVGVYDGTGRPWFGVDFTNGRYHIDRYADGDGSSAANPEETLYGSMGSNGLPDRKRKWSSGELLCAERTVRWQVCDPALQSGRRE